MKRVILFFGLLALVGSVFGQTLSSPDGNLQMNFTLSQQGEPMYELLYKKKEVIKPSVLGVEAEEVSLSKNFKVTSVSSSGFDETWTPVWGEFKAIRNHYNELTVTLAQQDATARQLTLRFRLFNDGLGFRYEYPEQANLKYFRLKEELTEFKLAGDHLAFCMPGDYDTNEFSYTTAHLSELKTALDEQSVRMKTYEAKAEGETVQTPLMLKSDDGLYINIHEAALVNYAGLLLNLGSENGSLSAHLTPDKLGVKGYLHAACQSPWRTIIVSDDARDLLASQTILNLNDPCKYEDTSWIKPTKYIGVWWEMFIGDKRTWAYSDYYNAKPGVTDYRTLQPNGRHAANTANVKKYIDFASQHGFDAILVEGWNEGWEDWAAYVKDHQFSFTTPYPDFDVKALKEYAGSKGVRLMMHHETSGNAADYERQLDKAFKFMVENGYNAVKTGYVGPIIPRSEFHSSQWMNDHYIQVVREAAKHRILINSHEAVRPTGLCRTYPNWIAQESARGTEFESMGGNNPDHTTILPFTRLMGGPMDYTPGVFQGKLDYYKGDKPNEKVNTTLVKQLALYVTMYSPLQMAADLPENYNRFADAFQFIKDVAIDWDDSRYLEAEPGEYITVARKAKGTNHWFVGSITDEKARSSELVLDFLDADKEYIATVYADTKKAHYLTNPQAYVISKGKVNHQTKLALYSAPGGGYAISIVETDSSDQKKGIKKLSVKQ